MSKRIVAWLIAAAALILLGGLIFGGAMTMLKWDFRKLSTVEYETNEYQIGEVYQNMTVVTHTADVVFVPSENGETKVVCRERQGMKHTVSVREDTLEILGEDTRKWYQYIGIPFGTPQITVYIPGGEYGVLSISSDTGNAEIPACFGFERMDITTSTGSVTSCASTSGDVKIKASTGAIKVEGISAANLSLTVSTGKITASGVRCTGDVQLGVTTGKTVLSDITCRNMTARGDTGRVIMEDLRAEGTLRVERSTGDVELHRCDAGEILIRTDTGDVTGTLLTPKIFLASTDTGRVEVPESITGGKCKITTDTGNIKLSIAE